MVVNQVRIRLPTGIHLAESTYPPGPVTCLGGGVDDPLAPYTPQRNQQRRKTRRAPLTERRGELGTSARSELIASARGRVDVSTLRESLA